MAGLATKKIGAEPGLVPRWGVAPPLVNGVAAMLEMMDRCIFLDVMVLEEDTFDPDIVEAKNYSKTI
ncbi:hypothetical protein MTR_5g019020 [Medicago truncatula]|uniref:Uncharacterized protein n=1 Tax=Medicago truncatula TaxID=3880 RepID=G7KAT2_MEDTR|nr:hypothetical protein MTR_5g019020 [Medicago truncatula]